MATASSLLPDWLNPLKLVEPALLRKKCCLTKACPNDACIIECVNSPEAQLVLLRFGLSVGDSLKVLAKLPAGGPMVLQCGQVELALGEQYANEITVSVV